MRLEQSFEVQAPVDAVWRALNDLERVAPCLPGATITGRDEAGTYQGEFTVKFGPATTTFLGTIRISEADETAHTATLVVTGEGGASAEIAQTLTAAGAATRVDCAAELGGVAYGACDRGRLVAPAARLRDLPREPARRQRGAERRRGGGGSRRARGGRDAERRGWGRRRWAGPRPERRRGHGR